jgi:hypothetical protein
LKICAERHVAGHRRFAGTRGDIAKIKTTSTNSLPGFLRQRHPSLSGSVKKKSALFYFKLKFNESWPVNIRVFLNSVPKVIRNGIVTNK